MPVWLWSILLYPSTVWAHSLYPTYIGLGLFGVALSLLLIWGIYRMIKYCRAQSKSNH